MIFIKDTSPCLEQTPTKHIRSNIMKAAFVFTFLFLSSLCIHAQQDAQFTQYVFNGLHINPAYAGYKEDLFVQSFYRTQWEGIKGAPKTFTVSADGATNEGNVGLGLIVTNDKIGAQRYLTAFANYAYRIRLGNDESSRLAFGLGLGIAQLGIDGNELSTIQDNDIIVPSGFQSVRVPDARFGIFYSNNNYYIGASATNILARYMSRKYTAQILVPVPQPHLYLTGGALFSLNEEIKFKPVVLLKEDFRGPGSLDISTFFLLKEQIWLGAFMRTSVNIVPKNNLQKGLTKESAMGAIIEIFATPNLRIGYSYDYSLNAIRNYNYGSHEISIGLYLKNKRPENGRLRCYDF